MAMLVIGLTGNIGTGKSTVAQILTGLGAQGIDADKLGHELLVSGNIVYTEIISAFGQSILNPGGEIDRKKLSEIVFNSPGALSKLNSIMHPRMYQLAEKQIQDYRQKGAEIVVLEAPILIEANWVPLVDQIWVTTSSEEVVNERLYKNKGIAPAQVDARRHHQLPQEEKVRFADVVISTDCTLTELETRVKRMWQEKVGR
jgi:dephospho-CoA kinase